MLKILILLWFSLNFNKIIFYVIITYSSKYKLYKLQSACDEYKILKQFFYFTKNHPLMPYYIRKYQNKNFFIFNVNDNSPIKAAVGKRNNRMLFHRNCALWTKAFNSKSGKFEQSVYLTNISNWALIYNYQHMEVQNDDDKDKNFFIFVNETLGSDEMQMFHVEKNATN